MKVEKNKKYPYQELRNSLIRLLREKGITDEAVLAVISKIPRHLFFIDTAFHIHAYKDQAFSIGAGQTISQPYTVAFQSQLLDIKAGDKILEVGTGSGYQTAVLIELGATVYTIERQRELFIRAQQQLHDIGYFPKFFYGDGYEGKVVFAPYNKIIVTAGAPSIPQALLKQLAVGGRMVIPVGEKDVQKMLIIDRISETKFTQKDYGSFAFVPLLKGTEK
ncbi:MAG: protein-L-isoaspartate(D-aspartate) O-methyltransferase [Prevotellaceae bacterium]|jgi:protein-L-isoaspartate(D-aspartate) O-methyltransferase|nr:protein-L-isoaspartate(D-aspartate) O-methyltransferase [Prevotellaceae bacterium]